MKAILKSIRPQHDKNILNGLKLIELDKSAPKEWKDYLSGKTKEKPKPREVFIYCTKDLNALLRFIDNRYMFLSCSTLTRKQEFESGKYLNGKVVAKFTLNKVEEIVKTSPLHYGTESIYKIKDLCCLTDGEIRDYLKGKNGYAWHIDNLVIFDKPKELCEFSSKIEKTCICFNQFVAEGTRKIPLTKAPQSWCYIEAD